MIIRQFFIPGIAHSSYLIGGVSSCLIVDPSRDSERYLAAAAEEGMKIAGILETHLHADFISGHREIADRTGAVIYMPEKAEARFPHVAVRQGTEIPLEDLKITVMETPGHTPEHVSYVLTHESRGDTPVAVFCGDTLFVGDVGRPDLFPGRARELAEKLFVSLHEGLLCLPDYCEVYPAHGAGSLCGRSLSSHRWTTIGYERRYNEALLITDQEEFISHLTTGMPAAPDHFSRCSDINRRGPKLLSDIPKPVSLSSRQTSDLIAGGTVEIVDLRRYDAFGGMHIRNSWNLDQEVNFSTFAGWILDPAREYILVGHQVSQIPDAVTMLHRVGIDSVRGYLTGGLQGWISAGYDSGHIGILSVHEMAVMLKESDPLVLDVRSPAEYQGYHIPGAVNLPWADLRTRFAELDRSRMTAVICGTGVRAGTACSILARNGFTRISNVAGGYNAWIAAGLG
jgi:glyoxylase-like metal-dependent hydrolase (beta-lactamase superfamily II)/rhodanese-related sulfurtransferase